MVTNSSNVADTDMRLSKYLDSVPSLWPSPGRISTPYGTRIDPFTYARNFHSGIDIAAEYGMDIKASASGTVYFSGYQPAYGYVVYIDHGNQISTVYGHASRLLVKVGQEVKKGEVIAKVGSSGRSTGPHLHFEVRVGENVADPTLYLDKR